MNTTTPATTDIGITQEQAGEMYRRGNNEGRGYPLGADSVKDAADAPLYHLALSQSTTADVAVVVDVDGTVIAIGGDAMGREPYAVEIGRLVDGEFAPRAAKTG